MRSIIFFMLLLPFLSMGQITVDNYRNYFVNLKTGVTINEGFDLNSPKILKGTYLKREWQSGRMYFNDKSVFSQFKFLYNLVEDKVLLTDSVGGELFELTDPKSLDSLFIGDQKFVYTMYGTNNKFGFFEEITDGNTRLLKRHISTYRPEVPTNGFKDAQPAYYYVSDHYLLQKKGESAIILPRKQKKILELFADKNTEIAKFVKDNKIKTKKEKDLKRLIHFYNNQL